jgi:hypothetical protein
MREIANIRTGNEVTKMGDQQPRRKRKGQLGLRRQCYENRPSQFLGETNILESAALGAPIERIVNTLCTAINLQIGNAVSLFSWPGGEDIHPGASIQSAIQFGLTLFWSEDILSYDRSRLGTLQIYCCDQRQPTWDEVRLIERVLHLAVVALQRRKNAEDCETSYRGVRRGVGGTGPEPPRFVN